MITLVIDPTLAPRSWKVRHQTSHLCPGKQNHIGHTDISDFRRIKNLMIPRRSNPLMGPEPTSICLSMTDPTTLKATGCEPHGIKSTQSPAVWKEL